MLGGMLVIENCTIPHYSPNAYSLDGIFNQEYKARYVKGLSKAAQFQRKPINQIHLFLSDSTHHSHLVATIH